MVTTNLDKVVVRAQYVDFDGNSMAGSVVFTPSTTVIDVAGKKILFPKQYVANLDSNGSIAIQIPASDDPDILPNIFTYKVQENIGNGRIFNNIQIPYASLATGFDLSTVLIDGSDISPPTYLSTSDATAVHKTGDETVAGTKTFSVSPVVPTPTSTGHATTKAYVDGVAISGSPDATATIKGILKLTGALGGTADFPATPTAVHLTGNETVAGVKTFSSSPTVPTPTTSTQVANKAYVDAAASTMDATDYGVMNDGTIGAATGTDNTASFNAFITTVKNNAARIYSIGGGLNAYHGLPRVYLPKGVYRLRGSINLARLRGLVIEGDGMESTVLQIETGDPIFDIFRASEIVWRNMTFTSYKTTSGVNDGCKQLVENSIGAKFHQLSSDPIVAGPGTTVYRFENVEFVGLHRGTYFTGDQMTDGVIFNSCKWRDNFYDSDYANGQAVNHQYIGGEWLGFVDLPEADYNTRLAEWSAGSKPITGPAGSITLLDGATFKITAGGMIQIVGGSVIRKGTTLLLGEPPSDLSQGTNANLLTFSFDTCKWELRQKDLVNDVYGYQRVTLLRYEMPHPPVFANTYSRTLQMVVSYNDCDLTVQVPDIDAMHLRNGVSIFATNTRILKQVVSTVYLVSHITGSGSTSNTTGRYVGHNSDHFLRRKVGGTPVAVPPSSSYSPSAYQDHHIWQNGRTGFGNHVTPFVREIDHSLVPGMVNGVVRHVLMEVDGTMPTVQQVVEVPYNCTLVRVGVVGISYSGTPADFTWHFKSADSVTTYKSLVCHWVTVSGTPAFDLDGVIVNNAKKASACMERLLTDGAIVLTPSPAPPINLLGYVYIEYC
jgi:hypothetical protein